MCVDMVPLVREILQPMVSSLRLKDEIIGCKISLTKGTMSNTWFWSSRIQA